MPDAAPPLPPTTPPPESRPPLSPEEKNARTWNMLCHISALAGYAILFGNVLGPLIVWQIKKNEIPSVDMHGKAALNFQLSVLLVTLPLIVIGIPTAFICIGFVFIGCAVLVGLCGIIFAIIAGIKANDGKEFKYPYSFNLIK